MAVRSSSRRGRDQRRKTPTGRARRPDLSRFYSHRLPSLTPAGVEWQLTLLRPRQRPLDIGTMIESFSWNDEAAAMTGNLQARRPDPQAPASLPIGRAQKVRCRVKWGGTSWYELWTMRTKPPQAQVETGTVSIDMEDDLALLTGTKRNWSYRTTKARRHGFTCDEIALLVAHRIGMRVGKLAKGKTRFPKLVMLNADPLDVLRAAYGKEHDAAGRKFVIRIRNGRLEVVPFARNPLLFVLGAQLQTAAVQEQPKMDQPFTVLTGHATVGKGKAAKKLRHTEMNRAAVNRLGYMHHDQHFGRVKSHAELRSKTRRALADALQVDHTAQVTHTGLPFVRRGDGAQLDLPREGFKGRKSFVFVDTAVHQVQGGAYTTDFTFTSTDPYLADQTRQAKEAKQRAAKRAARTRRRGH